jgi:hypothetical protein
VMRLPEQPLNRVHAGNKGQISVPSIVHEVLAAPGQPLNSATREFMEPRFGHDFSQVQVHSAPRGSQRDGVTIGPANDSFEQEAKHVADRVVRVIPSSPASSEGVPRHDFSRVRVHTNAKAAESARTVNALAYTSGNHIVFRDGHYAPTTTTGRQLLAHELAHVMQQQAIPQPMIQRKIDKISLDRCKFQIWMSIGIYGPRASAELAHKWQSWINTEWSKEVQCAGSNGTCPVWMLSTVNAYPEAERRWQVPETNRVLVAEPNYRSKAIGRWGKWAENEDRVSVAHETGHLMGLIDRYWQVGARKSMSRFENDIMGDYYRDPGPTEYHNALARVLARRRLRCPCCSEQAFPDDLNKNLWELKANVEENEAPDVEPLDPIVPDMTELA